jgi:hypothetical protein
MLTRRNRESHDPAADGRVSSLLAAAAAPTEPGPQPGESEAVAAFRVAASTPAVRRSPLPSSRTRTKAIAVAAGGLLLTATFAGAAGGALPGAAQDTAERMLGELGIAVPGPDEHAAGHADDRGSAEAPAGDGPAATDETGETTGTTGTEAADGRAGGSESRGAAGEDAAAAGQGATISGMARSDGTSGRDKGVAVSEEASDGESRAGENGVEDPPAGAQQERPQPQGDAGDDTAGGGGDQDAGTTPDQGGTGTADDAAGSGANTADSSSDGHSAAGSGNRP